MLTRIAWQMWSVKQNLQLLVAAKTGTDPRTPAPKKDRIRGSDRNDPGSASTSGSGIELSEEVEKSLAAKVKDHNEKHSEASKQTSLGTLKKVWRRGAGAFSVSHRPNVSSRQQWAMGRVNAFLYLLSNGRPKNPKYIADNDLLPKGHPKKVAS